ncbi:LLM class flavin-dependent oxidoreductase [Streptomyces sp. SID3343]|uniref:LLM class flavin-dependent oxidoreductase n=1 Tax=Streptomyces sp. SID3343 TaxID=2690260 RepID=UPI001369FB80|nr:LLM class flavin-dependent oxidoreductase [Streptomyces sp. SID3343]MYW00283.1 LLM class flavin-dependent oxidoreductase [Streptomyces sp. SID3343]
MSRTPLSVLDLLPLSQGDTHRDAVSNAIDLARRAEEFGYRRYWFAEHHFHPGVLGVSPALAIALVGQATDRIRLGSAGVQFGHRTALSVVEEFGLLDARYPGRLDLGIGRSIGRSAPTEQGATGSAGGAGAVDKAIGDYRARRGAAVHDTDRHTPNGLLLPKQFDFSKILDPARFTAILGLLQQPGAWTPDYDEQLGQVLDLLAGTYRSAEGVAGHAHPGEGADVELWVLGASGGESARVAGARGLRFAASYHHSPSTVLDSVEAYRAAFRPSADLPAPYVSVSADVVVAEDDATARELAAGYARWVRSIRNGHGAIPFPPSDDTPAHEWSDADRQLVRDRVETQFVGSPETVADRLEVLREATGADELVVTTITHRHADRVRSYELLAKAWADRD